MTREDISRVDLEQLEKFADKLFGKVGIDVEFTRHFLDRVNDVRNKKPITMSELTRLFKQEYKRWGKPIAQMGPDQEAVMKDLQTDINLPFALRWDSKNNELDLIAKTVMRKADFKTPNQEFPVEDVNFPSYADIKRNQSQPKMPTNPAITDPDGKVRGFYPDPQDAKQRASNIMYKAGRGLSRFIKGDPDYDPFDQRDAEVQKGTLPMSPYRDGSQIKPISKTQSSIYNPIDMDAMRAEIGAEYGLSANDVLKYSKADQPLPSQIDPKLIPKGKKMPTDAQVLAYRKDHPPVFNIDGSTVKENVPSTNKPGTIGQMINWGGKNAPPVKKTNVSVARRKQPDPQSWWQQMLAKGKDLFDDEQIEEESPWSVLTRKAGHVLKAEQYKKAAKFLHNILQRKYDETDGKPRHSLGYYAQMLSRQTGNRIDWRELQAEYLDTYGNAMFEKITKDTPMGDVIDDFYKSDAPQFKGKSKEKRRQMAIAAKLSMMDSVDENFADGKKKGKSRPGRVKRAGASCKGSVSELRKKAKNSSGEKQKMYHWCANMKSGRSKNK